MDKSGTFFGVVTTIQAPTDAIHKLAGRLIAMNAPLVIVGDKKGPGAYDIEGVQFLSLERQLTKDYALARVLPVGHYARKNIGYLHAIGQGADCIYETDDDNAPLPDWKWRNRMVEAHRVEENGWANLYRCFSDKNIWPRGFPLDAIRASVAGAPALEAEARVVDAPIQQGLANNSPDVDAIWRLVLDAPFYFDHGPSVFAPRGCWCPFNSQSTWWWPSAYPLLYLPSFCSFRMTDIWRSFIAQRCLWELDYGVVFHAPEVLQDRNPHDLMRDFNDEIPGYQRNLELASVLENLTLRSGEAHLGDNLHSCYDALINRNFLPEQELGLVDLWLRDLASVSE